MLEIELNGAPHRLDGARDLAALVDGLGLQGQALALAVNRCVVPRRDWPALVLQPGDKVDIVRAIGGG